MTKVESFLALILLAALSACASTALSPPRTGAAQSALLGDPAVQTVDAEDLARTGETNLDVALRRLVPALR